MRITHRPTTSMEEAMLKCNVLQENKMQCSKKPAKIVRSEKIPENVINANQYKNEFALCQAHFNTFLALNSNQKITEVSTKK